MTEKESATPAACPACSTPAAATDQFCESCGTALTNEGGSVVAAHDADVVASSEQVGAEVLGSTRTRLLIPNPSAPVESAELVRHCAACEAEIDADGYCTSCGVKAAKERDHFRETLTSWVGGVCDRGIRHYRNEDAMASAADAVPASWAALVVCDGVSHSTDSDRASLAAARAARDLLVDAHATGDTTSDRVAFWTDRLGAATAAAQEQARAVATETATPNPPSCTFVAAILDGATLVTGCVGDSRAYWLPDEGAAVQLSEDDSWVTEQVRMGVDRAVAEQDKQAHAITRWLGIDAPDPTPRCVATTAVGPGWLMLCSDGLWNYCSDAGAVRDLVQECATKDPEPTAVSAAMVDFANNAGGQDNITVVLARLPAPTT